MPTKLDERAVRTAAPPAKGAVSIWDTEIKGSACGFTRRRAAARRARRAFFVNYRSLGVERRLTIGEFPTWSALAARAEAKALRKRIDSGEDPARERREAREAPTVKDLAERYRREHLPRKAPSSQKADWAMIERRDSADPRRAEGRGRPSRRRQGAARKDHGERPAGPGEPGHRGREQDVRPVALANGRRERALARRGEGNPCEGIERNQEQGRERFFSTAELAALTDALAEHDTPAADCLRLIMLTGARPGEAMRARWAEFDEPGFWDKPSAHTKQRKRHRVPLSPAAIELIAKLRRKRADDSEFVFPGRIKGSRCANCAGLGGGHRSRRA